MNDKSQLDGFEEKEFVAVDASDEECYVLKSGGEVIPDTRCETYGAALGARSELLEEEEYDEVSVARMWKSE